MQRIPLTEIKVGDRQRIDLGSLSDLDSMADPEVGLVQPIVLDAQNKLIAGRRRLAKATQLGWTDIPFVRHGELTELQRQLMEFVEDVGRKDRSWQELCVATYRLHDMLSVQKAVDGERWTVRAMATFTGFEKSSVAQMIRIGRLLLAEPKDEQIWKAENYVAAVKVDVGRSEAEAREALERRRELARATTIIAETGEHEDAPDQPVQSLDTTAGEEPNVYYIHGRDIDFADSVPDEHYMAGMSRCILIPVWADRYLRATVAALHPQGYGITFSSGRLALFNEFRVMPVYWNTLVEKETDWPYSDTIVSGYCFTWPNNLPPKKKASSNVITCHLEDDGSLPLAVVDFCISPIVNERMAVLCVGSEAVLGIAQMGRVPMWFEPDKDKYAKTVAALQAYYEKTDPGCIVRLR